MIHPSFRDLLAKTTFQIVTIMGDPIEYRIADNYCYLYNFCSRLRCRLLADTQLLNERRNYD